MVSLVTLFWALLLLFAVVGALRGWAKELLVIFSMLVALMIITLVETYAPWLFGDSDRVRFFARASIILFMAFFGYQTPADFGGGGGGRREWLQNKLLGFILGLLNGYLIVGSLWYYLHEVDYLSEWETARRLIVPPSSDPRLAEAAQRIIENLPPHFLGVPWLYVAVTAAFVFVLVVFI